MPEHIDTPLESLAYVGTESIGFARYASTVAPVLHPRTIYLFKWLAIFFDGTNLFLVSHRNSSDGWQKAVDHNAVTEPGGTPHDVTEQFSPPLIGIPIIIGGESSNPNYGITQITQATSGEVSEPVVIDDVLNQMIGPKRITGSMKTIIDAGILFSLPDGGESVWSYKDNMSEHSANIEQVDTTVDMSDLTGELHQVGSEYAGGVFVDGGSMRGQPVSYVSFDDLGEVLIAQSIAPAPANDCIMIEWVLALVGGSFFQFPIVTPVAGQPTPYLIPIPDLKTLWDRAPSLLPYDGHTVVRGIVNKLYPQYASEEAWRAAGAHF